MILHDIDDGHQRATVTQRLAAAGLDMNRVHLLRPLPHHKLLALLHLSEVSLDSYYAGGCTTTRDAFEVDACGVGDSNLFRLPLCPQPRRRRS